MKKIDAHIHTYGDASMDQMEGYMREMMETRGYCGLGFAALLHETAGFFPESNNMAIEMKRRIPGCYAFASLDHGKDFIAQTKEFMAQGFDGIKLLEGKPSEYRFWGTGYEGPRMEQFFAYAEEQDIPLLIHNNDPRANWDLNHPWREILTKKGWFYGDCGLPSQEEFFVMLEEVFARHPNLRAAIAHMGFYYDNLPRAAALLDKCPNLYLDMTPAVEVYWELSEKPEESATFLRKYHNRLFFGTDTSMGWAPGSGIRSYNDMKVRMMTVFYEGTAPEVVEGHTIVPMGLEPETVEEIYYYNFLKFLKK